MTAETVTMAATPSPPRRRALYALAGGALALLGLSACATDKAGAELKPAAAQPLPPRERVSKAIELLFQGKPAQARPLLLSALQDQPTNDMARKLLTQIDTDPKTLLGEKSYPHRARAGETASSLAADLMGDPLMFYALARYNQIDPPSRTLDGRTVMIPGEAKRAPAPRPAQAAKPATRPAQSPAQPAAPGGGRDPARAAKLRSAGLVQMNKGAIGAAVIQLQQAQALDPGNPAIQRDLDRALRIQRTVKAR